MDGFTEAAMLDLPAPGRNQMAYGEKNGYSTDPPAVTWREQVIHRTKHDHEMAKRQTSYHSLTKKERKKQDEWARGELMYNAGQCRGGWKYLRIKGGYRCEADAHIVTDELIAEGKGGYYQIRPESYGHLFGRGNSSIPPPVFDGPLYGQWPMTESKSLQLLKKRR